MLDGFVVDFWRFVDHASDPRWHMWFSRESINTSRKTSCCKVWGMFLERKINDKCQNIKSTLQIWCQKTEMEQTWKLRALIRDQQRRGNWRGDRKAWGKSQKRRKTNHVWICFEGFGKNRLENQLLQVHVTLTIPGDIDFEPTWTYFKSFLFFLANNDARILSQLCRYPPFSISDLVQDQKSQTEDALFYQKLLGVNIKV